MDNKLLNLTIGALVHDIGKVIFRASNQDSQSHSLSGKNFFKEIYNEPEILDCILFHHKKDLKNAQIQEDSLAYIVYYADNIASGVDRREKEEKEEGGFSRYTPLKSIFNLMNNNTAQEVYNLQEAKEMNFPKKEAVSNEILYNKLFNEMKDGLKRITYDQNYVNSLIELLETYLSYVPSSTFKEEVEDISLYDHLKLTAAISACIYKYLKSKGQNSYKQLLYNKEKDFSKEKAFLMFSCDISGIQQFIYTISSKGALKSLRSRSFYLEIILEHIMDMMLDKFSLTRANLIYTGGGHSYALLPNTIEVKEEIKEIMKKINRWFLKHFETSLFIAYAYEECSANDLMNIPYERKPYINIFKQLSSKISKMKLARYDLEDIKFLNTNNSTYKGRECKVCSTINSIVDNGRFNEEYNVCENCNMLYKMSSRLIKDNTLILTSNSKIQEIDEVYLPIPSISDSENYMYVISEEKALELLKIREDKVLRLYGKNNLYTGLKYGCKIWCGTYYYALENKEMPTFEELANGAEGIKRIAVLRADVDDLGSAFVSGFTRKNKDDCEKYRYHTLSRTASLSRQLSMFFKYYINDILAGNIKDIKQFKLRKDEDSKEKKAVIVYSGGDDVFIVGAWDDIIEAAVDLRSAFLKYTGKTLHFSAGIGMFYSGYPISRMAKETENLEDCAKSIDLEKDAISLFGMEVTEHYEGKNVEYRQESNHTYKWDEFLKSVIDEKLRTVEKYFDVLNKEEEKRGMTLIYKLMSYIIEIKKDRINIARFAYLLGKMKPKNNNSDMELLYRDFSNQMYSWILNKKDRKQLLTAINLYVYLNRKETEKEVN
jgi:CRISPR-associated protein Csm1